MDSVKFLGINADMGVLIFQLHVMDSHLDKNVLVAILEKGLSTPCNGFGRRRFPRAGDMPISFNSM